MTIRIFNQQVGKAIDKHRPLISKSIADNICVLRNRMSLSQHQLARLSGIPRSTLTLLESGSANPSIYILNQVSEALGCKIEELLSPVRRKVVHTLNESIPCHTRSKQGVCIRKLLPDNIPHLDFEEVILNPRAIMVGSPHTAGTKEYLYCTQGKLVVTLEHQNYEVKKGDVLAFPGSIKHSYRNASSAQETRFLSLVALASLNEY